MDLLFLFVSVIDEDDIFVGEIRTVDETHHFLVGHGHVQQFLFLGFLRHCYEIFAGLRC